MVKKIEPVGKNFEEIVDAVIKYSPPKKRAGKKDKNKKKNG